MSNIWKVAGVFFGLIVIFGILPYIALIGADEAKAAAWGNVEAVLQRRADLIPNLVSTVKGYAAHEEKVFTEVTEARAALGDVTVNIGDSGPTAEQLSQLAAAQNNFSGALSRLIAVAEAYPELKASENFMALQDQLEGSENRISVERQRYNDAVRAYNTKARIFFYLGFEKAESFKATEGAGVVPKVEL